MPRKKKKVPNPNDWATSEGRKLLREDLRENRIPPSMHWTEVYQMRPEFQVGETLEEAERLFENRLITARQWVQKKQQRADEEEVAMVQDRLVCPPRATGHRGEPRWQGSVAEAKLKEDVAAGIHLTMSNEEFYNSRPEYSQFLQSTILSHIRQEVRTTMDICAPGGLPTDSKHDSTTQRSQFYPTFLGFTLATKRAGW